MASFISGIFKKRSNKIQRDSQDKLRINFEDLSNEPPDNTKIFGKTLLEAVWLSVDYIPPPIDFPHSSSASYSSILQKFSSAGKISTYPHTQATILRSYVPIVVRKCVEYLNNYCLQEEGLYRIPGNKKKVQIYQRRFDFGEDLDFSKELEKEDVKYIEPHDIAALLLTYFKELKHNQLFDQAASEILLKAKWQEMQEDEKILMIKNALAVMPQENLETLRFFVEHMLKVAANSEKNQMTKRNLLICFCGTSPFAPVFYNLLNFTEKIFDENDKRIISVRKQIEIQFEQKIESQRQELLNEMSSKANFSIENMALPQLPDDNDEKCDNNDEFNEFAENGKDEFKINNCDTMDFENRKFIERREKRRKIMHNESLSSSSSNSEELFDAATVAAEEEKIQNNIATDEEKAPELQINERRVNAQVKKRNSVTLLSTSVPSQNSETREISNSKGRLFPEADLKKLFRQNSLQMLLNSPSNSGSKKNANFEFSERLEEFTNCDENKLEELEENFKIINNYLKNEEGYIEENQLKNEEPEEDSSNVLKKDENESVTFEESQT